MWRRREIDRYLFQPQPFLTIETLSDTNYLKCYFWRILILDSVQNSLFFGFMPKQDREQPDVSEALRDAGLQVTAQRLAVFRAVQSSPHAMADEICDDVREEIGAISRQAVYDALKAMFEHGLIRRIQPAGSSARYEVRLDNHHHLVCRECSYLVDINSARGKAPRLDAKDSHGYLIDEAEVIYWGICPDCQ